MADDPIVAPVPSQAIPRAPAPPGTLPPSPEDLSDLATPIRRSETLGALALALAKAQAEIRSASRDSENPFFKSKYASLASVWEACRAALSSNELAVLQPTKCAGTRVTITTLLVHSSGEWVAETLTMHAAQNTPQAIGSAITYGRRYGLSAMVGVAAADDDDDGALASDTLPKGVRKSVRPFQPDQPETVTTLPTPVEADPIASTTAALGANGGSPTNLPPLRTHPPAVRPAGVPSAPRPPQILGKAKVPPGQV